jgi:hypothetical protein
MQLATNTAEYVEKAAKHTPNFLALIVVSSYIIVG